MIIFQSNIKIFNSICQMYGINHFYWSKSCFVSFYYCCHNAIYSVPHLFCYNFGCDKESWIEYFRNEFFLSHPSFSYFNILSPKNMWIKMIRWNVYWWVFDFFPTFEAFDGFKAFMDSNIHLTFKLNLRLSFQLCGVIIWLYKWT